MSENKPKCSVVSLAIIMSSLLAIAESIGGVTNFQALGQQNTTTVSNETSTPANQTGATMQNQTGGSVANMTAADLEPVTNSINDAREALQSNDTAAAP